MVNKLAHHFGRGIQIAVITQGIKSLEELLLLLTKWDNVDNQSSGNNNNEPARKQFQPQQQQQEFKNKPCFQRFNESNVSAITEANAKKSNQKTSKVARHGSVR